MRDAARWIDQVGFCLLFASTHVPRIELPSLFEAVKGRRNAHIDEWDADSDRVWGWKNDLPATHRAYYGKALTGKPMFIARAMLPHVLAVAAPDNVPAEYRRGRISHAAKKIYDALAATGPTPTMALRAAAGLNTVDYHHALDELQRRLVIAPVGATTEQSAWPSQIFDLVARWFPREFNRAQQIDQRVACRAIVRKYLATVRAATPAMISRTLGLSREDVSIAVNAEFARRSIKQIDTWILWNDRSS
jgi:hypothetical protein